MLLDQQGKIIGTIAQPTVWFESDEDYFAWIDDLPEVEQEGTETVREAKERYYETRYRIIFKNEGLIYTLSNSNISSSSSAHDKPPVIDPTTLSDELKNENWLYRLVVTPFKKDGPWGASTLNYYDHSIVYWYQYSETDGFVLKFLGGFGSAGYCYANTFGTPAISSDKQYVVGSAYSIFYPDGTILAWRYCSTGDDISSGVTPLQNYDSWVDMSLFVDKNLDYYVFSGVLSQDNNNWGVCTVKGGSSSVTPVVGTYISPLETSHIIGCWQMIIGKFSIIS